MVSIDLYRLSTCLQFYLYRMLNDFQADYTGKQRTSSDSCESRLPGLPTHVTSPHTTDEAMDNVTVDTTSPDAGTTNTDTADMCTTHAEQVTVCGGTQGGDVVEGGIALQGCVVLDGDTGGVAMEGVCSSNTNTDNVGEIVKKDGGVEKEEESTEPTTKPFCLETKVVKKSLDDAELTTGSKFSG